MNADELLLPIRQSLVSRLTRSDSFSSTEQQQSWHRAKAVAAHVAKLAVRTGQAKKKSWTSKINESCSSFFLHKASRNRLHVPLFRSSALEVAQAKMSVDKRVTRIAMHYLFKRQKLTLSSVTSSVNEQSATFAHTVL